MLKKISIIIPCFNEELGIGQVLSKIPKTRLFMLGYTTEVIVIDNDSVDDTAKVAKRYGAKVVHEKLRGKGNAIITGFQNVSKDSDIVVMIDGDDSYDASEIVRMIEPIDADFCEVVVGSRLHGRMCAESMPMMNRIGNWFFTFLARVFYQANVTDVCSGFFAWRKDVIDRLLPYIGASDFSIEMEMITKMARMRFDMYSVPISYKQRAGTTNLQPIRDGIVILRAWRRNLGWGLSIPLIKPAKYKQAVRRAS